MKKALQVTLCCVSLLCAVVSLPSTPDANSRSSLEEQRDGQVHVTEHITKGESLEDELRELRLSINTNRQNIESLSRKEHLVRVGQLEFASSGSDDELTEVRPLDLPLDAHDTDDVVDLRRYATTTLRPVDVETPVFEEEDEDEEEVEHEERQSGEEDESEHSGDNPRGEIQEHKRGRARVREEPEETEVDYDDEDDDDDDDDDDEDENQNDESDDDDDSEEDDDKDEIRKKKNVKVVAGKVNETVVDGGNGKQGKLIRNDVIVRSDDVSGEKMSAETSKEALLRNLKVFLGSKSGDHREFDFQGVDKIHQIREIDKRVNLPQKEKYINAVNPKADEDLLELMVKIAENPQEWQNIHGILQQIDQDLVASRDAVLQIKSEHATQAANKRDEYGVGKAKPKPNNMTKEERKHQQEEKKKKKKKKQRQKEKQAKQREREKNRNKLEGKEGSDEAFRRQQLTKAGVLSSDTSSIKDDRKEEKQLKPNLLMSTTVRPTQLPTSEHKAWLPAELTGDVKITPQGKDNKMKTISSAIDYLSKNEPKIITHDHRPKPKSPMQEVREKWPKSLSGIMPQINTAKAIATGRLRPADVNGNRIRYFESTEDKEPTITEPNDWSKSNIASESIQDKERARTRFLTDTVIAKNNVVQWKPNARAKWLETAPLPAKEQRANPSNNYFNGNPTYKLPPNGWQDFSVDSLKHGNLGKTVKTLPAITIEEQNGNLRKNWPQLPVDSDKDIVAEDWPVFQPDPVHAVVNTDGQSSWGKYHSAINSAVTKHREEALSKTWPELPHSDVSSLVEHAKEVAGAANNKPWPHFAYHRVTSSPQSLARQQKEAQQRARHRNAYIAVSIIAPPRKNGTSNASQPITDQRPSPLTTTRVMDDGRNQTRHPPLADKMDQLLQVRGHKAEKLTPIDPLEEQLIDMAAAGATGENQFNWNHSKHLDKLQEQLKTLSEMEEKLHFQWLEKERLRQTLRDGGKAGLSYFRETRGAESSQHTKTTTPDSVTPFDTTNS